MTQERRFRSILPWIFLLMLVVFVTAMPRRLISPLLLRIAVDFSVTYDVAASVFVTGSFGFITGLLASGFVSRVLTHRWTVVASGGMSGAVLLVLSMVPTLLLFHVVFFFAGVASGLYPGSGLASVQAIATPVHRGVALGLHELGPGLSFVVAPLLVAYLAPTIEWRGVMRLAGLFALGSTVLFGALGRASSEPGEPPHLENLRLFIRNRDFWVLTVVLTLIVTAANGVYAVLPTFLHTVHALDEVSVNLLVSGGRVLAFGSMIAAGGLMDRFGFKPVALTILIAAGVATALIGLAAGGVLFVAVALQPAIVAAYLPLSWGALSDIVPARARPLSLSLAIALSSLISGGVAPRVLAAAGAAGRFGLGFVILGLCIIAGSSTILLLTRPSGDANN